MNDVGRCLLHDVHFRSVHRWKVVERQITPCICIECPSFQIFYWCVYKRWMYGCVWQWQKIVCRWRDGGCCEGWRNLWERFNLLFCFVGFNDLTFRFDSYSHLCSPTSVIPKYPGSRQPLPHVPDLHLPPLRVWRHTYVNYGDWTCEFLPIL